MSTMTITPGDAGAVRDLLRKLADPPPPLRLGTLVSVDVPKGLTAGLAAVAALLDSFAASGTTIEVEIPYGAIHFRHTVGGTEVSR